MPILPAMILIETAYSICLFHNLNPLFPRISIYSIFLLMKINMTLKKIIIVLIFIFCFVGCDQSSKQMAKYLLANSTSVSYLSGFIRLEYVENSGAVFGLGSGLPSSLRFIILLISISIILFLFVQSVVIKKKQIRLKEISLVILLSGGIGNLLDRIFNEGKVIDFIIVGTANIHTAVFNFADIFITVGTLLFIFSSAKLKSG